MRRKSETIPLFIYYNSMKKMFALAAFAVLLLGSGAAFGAEWTEYENSLALGVLQIRLESRSQADERSALDWLTQKRAEFFSSIKEGQVCDEAKLSLENLFAVELYHYMWELAPTAKATDKFILEQFDKTVAWNNSHPVDSRNEWYSLSAYEVINTAMPLIKYSKKISFGLEEKNVYDSLIDAKCDKGLLYLNAGLWHAFAPAIGGGRDSKAKEYFLTAAKIGPSGFEKFFGYVYLSQMEFRRGGFDAALPFLAEADKISPGNVYTEFVRRMNRAGCDIFEYANDREGVDAKARKFYKK